MKPWDSLHALAENLDALLPQTQCRQCGFAGCRPYAEAIAAGRADIDQCPPGGNDLVRDLATLLGVPVKPVNRAFGVFKPPAVAVIDEQTCIGCTLCIQACPVDAIVGAAKVMHTVIIEECTGCELCIAPCPVDCIQMMATGEVLTREQKRADAARSRRRFQFRSQRLQREREERPARLTAPKALTAEEKKRATLQKAMARARARLQQREN
jgi:electron transport complex protein RnfB